MSSIMAKKHTGFSNRSYIATLFLFFVIILLACTKGKEQPSASVPADCQQFLDKYFDAWKSKDIATLSTYRPKTDQGFRRAVWKYGANGKTSW